MTIPHAIRINIDVSEYDTHTFNPASKQNKNKQVFYMSCIACTSLATSTKPMYSLCHCSRDLIGMCADCVTDFTRLYIIEQNKTFCTICKAAYDVEISTNLQKNSPTRTAFTFVVSLMIHCSLLLILIITQNSGTGIVLMWFITELLVRVSYHVTGNSHQYLNLQLCNWSASTIVGIMRAIALTTPIIKPLSKFLLSTHLVISFIDSAQFITRVILYQYPVKRESHNVTTTNITHSIRFMSSSHPA
jgi:hypothetical protein